MTQEQKIANLMEKLDITREEALDVIEYDKQVERSAKFDPYKLSEEQEKASKKARQADRAKSENAEKPKRERKSNNDKRFLIEVLSALPECSENLTVINPEREFTFMYNGVKYKIVLSAPRS